MNLIDVATQFATDEQCLAFFEALRWPDGVRCPECSSDHVSKITRKTVTKNKRGTIYACLNKECATKQFSATSGTIFADSHLPLRTWFLAISLVVDAKKGISAKQLQNHLNIGSYRTAWYMTHRIRKAMEESGAAGLFGTVEIDETYMGGKQKGKGNRGRSTAKKDVVMGLRQRGGPVKFVHVPDAKAATIQAVVEKHVNADVELIMTDDFASYPFALKNYEGRHRTINHSKGYYVTGDAGEIHTNTVESAFSLLKRGVIGSFHSISIKHLHRYLSEFEWRFNARHTPDRFEQTLRRMLQGDTMPYAELIAEEKA